MILTSFQPDFIPLLQEVRDCDIVTMHPQFTRMLVEANIPARTINEFATPQMIDASRNMAAIGLLDYFQYRFTDEFTDNRHAWLINNLPGYFYARLGDIALIILCLNEAHPDLIMLHNDVEPMNRLLALWAKENNVPCLHVPHAVYLEHSGRGAIGSDVHDLVTASHIACSGQQQADWYAARGATQLFLTGLPKTDKLLTYTRDKHLSARMLGLETNRPIVVYCSSWRQDTNLLGCHDGVEESYREFLNAAKTLPELQYVVKTHPRGNNLEWHKQLAKEAGVRCIVLEQHIEVVLAAADLVITYGASNVALEAAIHPYTRIAILGDELAMPNDPEIYKISEGKLIESIKLLLASEPPNYLQFLQKYFVALDGNSSLRIAKLARTLHGPVSSH